MHDETGKLPEAETIQEDTVETEAIVATDALPRKDTPRAKVKPRAKRRKRRQRLRAIEVALLCVSLCLLLIMGSLLAGVWGLSGALSGLFRTTGLRANPPAGTYSIINIEGTIQSGGSGYQHTATVDFIKKMTEDEDNLGLLLYINSTGGGVYESDEVYRTLMRYKEETGRPVWAYMGKNCASGGYYIAAAADVIYADPNCTTGSIGVYYQLTDTSGLYGMLGIETVLVRSGTNKGIGVDGVEITEENRAVYQSMVDETYDTFVGLVAESRGLADSEARTLADGRPYTAKQALENGLLDEIAEYDDVKQAFEDELGGEGYNTNFTTTSSLRQLVSGLLGSEKGETEALLELAESQPSGLMVMAEGLS